MLGTSAIRRKFSIKHLFPETPSDAMVLRVGTCLLLHAVFIMFNILREEPICCVPRCPSLSAKNKINKQTNK